MDLTDFSHELGEAKGGNTVFASVKDMKENKKCVEECGYCKVEVQLVEVLQEPNYNLDDDGEEVPWEYSDRRIVSLQESLEKAKKHVKWYENKLKSVIAGKPKTKPVLTDRHLTLYDTLIKRGEGNICNDLDSSEEQLLTQDEWTELAKYHAEINGDYSQWVSDGSCNVMMDFMVTFAIQRLLIDSYKEVRNAFKDS